MPVPAPALDHVQRSTTGRPAGGGTWRDRARLHGSASTAAPPGRGRTWSRSARPIGVPPVAAAERCGLIAVGATARVSPRGGWWPDSVRSSAASMQAFRAWAVDLWPSSRPSARPSASGLEVGRRPECSTLPHSTSCERVFEITKPRRFIDAFRAFSHAGRRRKSPRNPELQWHRVGSGGVEWRLVEHSGGLGRGRRGMTTSLASAIASRHRTIRSGGLS